MHVVRVGSVAAVAALVAGLAMWSLGGSATAAPVPLFSSSTPGFQAGAATVPAGIGAVTITVDGGHGGESVSEGPAEVVATAVGGVGASVTVRVSVNPGDVFAVQVGGAGTSGASSGAGGAGGGGGGNPEGGGGGGASAVSV